MAYTSPSFPTKKALREAIKSGREVIVYQPGGIFPLGRGSEHSVEGPSDGPHTWYARVRVDASGKVVKVLG